jgi:hypothetical protein
MLLSVKIIIASMQSNSPRTRQDLGLHEKPQNVAEGAAEMWKALFSKPMCHIPNSWRKSTVNVLKIAFLDMAPYRLSQKAITFIIAARRT